MPRARLMTVAQEDLQALEPEFRQHAVDAIRYLETHPGEGYVVSRMQYEADPELPRPCTCYERKTGTGFRLFVYFEVEGGELKVYQIRRVAMM